MLILVGCNSSPQADIRKIAGPTMGTRYAVSYVGGPAPAELRKLVDKRLLEINRQMSTYDPQSELSRFNQHESDDWFPVSAETVEVVAYALQVAKDTDGAFDPTVGPVVNLWGFGPDEDRTHPPSDEEIAAALARVGYQHVVVRQDSPALRKTQAGIYLDLSAVAKGFGVDAISALLADQGCTSSMVEVGGEIRTRGRKPDGKPWRIGIERPDTATRELGRVLELSDTALATSGDYRNFFEDQGHRYSHTINPATGRPVEHELASVSVIADTCMEADATATALMVLGPDRGYHWSVERRVAALLMTRTADGEIKVLSTPAFDNHPPATHPEP